MPMTAAQRMIQKIMHDTVKGKSMDKKEIDAIKRFTPVPKNLIAKGIARQYFDCHRFNMNFLGTDYTVYSNSIAMALTTSEHSIELDSQFPLCKDESIPARVEKFNSWDISYEMELNLNDLVAELKEHRELLREKAITEQVCRYDIELYFKTGDKPVIASYNAEFLRDGIKFVHGRKCKCALMRNTEPVNSNKEMYIAMLYNEDKSKVFLLANIRRR